MVAYTPAEYNYLGVLSKTYIIPARENQFYLENNFNSAPVRRIASAMKKDYAFLGSYTENALW